MDSDFFLHTDPEETRLFWKRSTVGSEAAEKEFFDELRKMGVDLHEYEEEQDMEGSEEEVQEMYLNPLHPDSQKLLQRMQQQTLPRVL